MKAKLEQEQTEKELFIPLFPRVQKTFVE